VRGLTIAQLNGKPVAMRRRLDRNARAFQLATAKVGASDYHALVESKLQIAGELYQSMVNEFREMRSFLLELIVVVILIIELVMLFRGQHS